MPPTLLDSRASIVPWTGQTGRASSRAVIRLSSLGGCRVSLTLRRIPNGRVDSRQSGVNLRASQEVGRLVRILPLL
jgi:hypothetical protein